MDTNEGAAAAADDVGADELLEVEETGEEYEPFGMDPELLGPVLDSVLSGYLLYTHPDGTTLSSVEISLLNREILLSIRDNTEKNNQILQSIRESIEKNTLVLQKLLGRSSKP